jgi:hypothetical protein
MNYSLIYRLMPYQISRAGKVLGVFNRRQIIEGVMSGVVSERDYAWREGMASWAEIRSMGLSSLGPSQPRFWDEMPAGLVPAECPHCGGSEPLPLQSTYQGAVLIHSANGITVSSPNPWDAPPPQPSTMALGFALYLLGWPIANAACLMITIPLGDSWMGLGLLLSFSCLTLLIIWHRRKIAANNLNHAKTSYIWRNSYRCQGCGRIMYSLDPDAAEEVGPGDLQPG